MPVRKWPAKGIDIKGVFTAPKLLPLGFLVLILIGGCILSLPAASSTGVSIGFLNAMFTSTSAVCVTGLSVIEVGTALSLFGQIVLLILLQIGGLGFVAVMTIIPVMLGKRLTLNQRMLIREAMNENNLGGMVQLIIWAIKMTLACELVGAVLLSFRFIADFGLLKGIYYSVFHSVSAFCNAGFDLLGEGNSISRYVADPLVSLTLCALIIAGGIGFGVINDVIASRNFKKLKLHSKLVLSVSGMLFAAGTIIVLITEWNNPETLGTLGFWAKLQAAFFQSVTFRTAGFYTVSQQALEPATKLAGTTLMFIGAGPASTGGGMKVTTVTILVLLTMSIIRGKRDVTAFGRRIGEDIVRRSMSIVLTGLAALITATFLISTMHPELALIDVMYECVSAVCTVGLTSAGTVNYCLAAKLIIMLLMFMGRTGPMSLALAVAMKQQNTSASMRLPEEHVTVG